MKNTLTLFALMISVSGIVVSLAREEVRCYLGLSSTSCPPTPNNSVSSPSSAPSALEENKIPESETLETKVKIELETRKINEVNQESLDLAPIEDLVNNTPPETVKLPTTSEQVLEKSIDKSPLGEDSPQFTNEPIELEVIPPPAENTLW